MRYEVMAAVRAIVDEEMHAEAQPWYAMSVAVAP
jgi:hypothetical protein